MKLRRSTKKDLLNYLLLGLFLIISYLPVSSFLFAMKNDALTDNFPNKYFFSAALQSGHLPLWNPYINFGLPLYADPGFAFWEPLTWVFGFIGYNIYTLTIEVLIYIWLGGVFMYELGKYFHHSVVVCLCMAMMYMCCGFFIGNLQHINFITSAAFLPIAIKTFLQLQGKFTYQRLLCCSLSLYFIAAGGHPAIPVAAIYFFAAILLGLIFFKKHDGVNKMFFLQLAKTNFLLLISFVVLISPLIYSYSGIIPYFSRSNPVNQITHIYGGFSLHSYLSFLFPFATTVRSSFFGDDLLMRDAYFSFIGFAFLIVSLFSSKNKYQAIFLFSAVVMLIISFGGSVKTFIYPYLPLLKYISTNGEYRVFAICSFIVAISFPLNKLLHDNNSSSIDKIFFIFLGLCVALLVWVICHPSQLLFFSEPQQVDPGNKIKWWMDNLKLYDRLLINAAILIVFLCAYFFFKKIIRLTVLIPSIILIDFIIFSWLHLPFTGVQKRSVSSIENYFAGAPKGIPIPSLMPLKNNIRPGEDLEKIIGCWAYYGKQPGSPQYCDYPVIFSSTKKYFHSSLPEFINEQPFIFLRAHPTDSSSLHVRRFSPTCISVETNNQLPDTVVLLQNYYPKWEAFINQKPITIRKAYSVFMEVSLSAGHNTIEFYYRDRYLEIVVIIAFLIWVILFLLAFKLKKLF